MDVVNLTVTLKKKNVERCILNVTRLVCSLALSSQLTNLLHGAESFLRS
jgi:hypothetical protein